MLLGWAVAGGTVSLTGRTVAAIVQSTDNAARNYFTFNTTSAVCFFNNSPQCTIKLFSVVFFAALVALGKSPVFGKGDAKTVIRLLLFLGALFVFAFVVGAVVYFTGR